MSLLDLILGRKKIKKEESVKEPEKQEIPRPRPPEKPPANTNGFEQKQATILMSKQKEDVRKAVMIKEEPMITVTREISEVKYILDDLKKAMLRDHHRILDEFERLPKSGDFADILDHKLQNLKGKKEALEKEIKTTELQKDVINVLSEKDMLSAAEIAEKLGRSRTWVSLQVAQLANQGVIEHQREGKHVKYKLTEKEEAQQEPILMPPPEPPKPEEQKTNGFNETVPETDDEYL